MATKEAIRRAKAKYRAKPEVKERNAKVYLDWQRTPKGKFCLQKARARQRGVEWQFTFETWWKMWVDSGKWEERGTRAGQYQLCRNGDTGPYSPENCRIDTMENNHKEWRAKCNVEI